MNMKNVKVGQVIKGYPKLCTLLGEKKRTGTKGKNYHLKEISRYVNLEQVDKTTFIIHEVYETPLNKIDNRVNNKRGDADELYQPAEQILMHMLANAPILDGTNRIVQLTRNNLFVNLGYVNDNFKIGNAFQTETSEILGVSQYATQEYFIKTYDKARQRVNTLLRKMKDRHNINYTLGTMVCDIDGLHRKPTEHELQCLLNIGKQTLIIMGLKDMTGVRLTNRYDEYNRRVNQELNGIGIKYSYECYDIMIADSYVKEIKAEYQRQIAKGETIETLRRKINSLSLESCDKTTNKIFNKLLDYEPTENDKEYIHMLKDTFVDDSKLLSNVCGNINCAVDLKKEILGK